MTINGHIENGTIVLDDGVELPEGASVQIVVVDIPDTQAVKSAVPTLADTLKDFIGILEDLPEDAAHNHDHYLYGAPKKS